jgi:Phage ORF5 protein
LRRLELISKLEFCDCMKMHIFSVKDRATDQFGAPMFMLAEGQAKRSFSDEVNRQAQDNQLYQHPDDFDLYFLGHWYSENATFEVEAPTLVVRGKDIAAHYTTPAADLRSVK